MSTDLNIAPADLDTLAPTGLAALAPRALYSAMGDINTAFTAAETAYQAAQSNLMVLLTEQIARHAQTDYPGAALVFVRTAADFHHDEDGNPIGSCEGHHHRLAPFDILDSEGNVLGQFAALSPVTYLMERLTPMLGLENQVLDLATREWALDCTDQ